MLRTGQLLHREVARSLAAEIRGGNLEHGDKLPSEAELTRRFAVSRATVRRALRELAAAGLVAAEPGRGSFVTAAAPLSEPPNTLRSFTELGAARGLHPTARVLASRVVPADLDAAEAFGVTPGVELFVLERLRLLDGLAISVDATTVPLGLAPALRETDFRTGSLYAVLVAAGAAPVRAEYAVEAVAADESRAALLEVSAGFPLLRAATTAYDAADRVVERGTMHYRGDRYRFRATLAGRSGP